MDPGSWGLMNWKLQDLIGQQEERVACLLLWLKIWHLKRKNNVFYLIYIVTFYGKDLEKAKMLERIRGRVDDQQLCR